MKKITKKFQLSVEGETEILYLKHLENIIKKCPDSTYNISIVPRKYKSPGKYVKSLTVTKGGTKKNHITLSHIFDYESGDEEHQKNFFEVIDQIQEIKKKKEIKDYKIGYSNFAFELWIIMHKKDASPVAHRKNYLTLINSCYNKKFQYIDDYKKEDNFKSILDKIRLDDVIKAVERGKKLRNNKVKNGDSLLNYKGFEYYRDNPDITVGEVVEMILLEVGIL